MQHVKVKYSQKPHLKKGAGWFGKSFYRYRVWQDNHRYNYYDRHRRNVAIRLGGLLVIGVGILGYSAVAPRPSSTVGTKLNTPVSFGNQGKNAQLTSQVFNPKTGTLQLGVKFTGSADMLVSDVNMNRFKLTFDGDRFIKKGQSQVNIIPTYDNTLVVQFVKLRKGFQDVRVNIRDTSLDAANITAADRVGDDDNKTTKQKAQVGTLIVNNDNKLTRNNTQPVDSQKTLVLAQTKSEITDQKRLIQNNKSAITKWQKAITQRTENSRATRKEMSQMNAEEIAQAEELISNNDSAITDIKTNIARAKSNISSANDKIKTLQKLYKKQQNGNLKVAKVH